ncbi:MAG: peptidoglycan DD-metalloendopeptidase family protein, partial [Deltaproteobacteria bacterium]|nr:peptidoglycan DD-metalloendopeptidase family protein [Deltaproteobacteria bacterium]
MSRRRSTPRLRLWLFLVLGVLLVTPLFFRPTVTSTEANMSEPAALPQPPVPEIRKEIIKGTVAQGDTATSILGDYFTAGEIYELSKLCKSVFPLSRLSAGQAYRLCLSDDDFERFEYDIDHDEQLIITREAEDFSVQKVPIPYTTETVGVRGTIETSLFEAVTSTGESDVLAMNLADIFAWDIDFILDIRKGDSFQALVEKRYRDAQPAGYGRIMAAEFTNQGETFQAFLYQDGDRRPDYFDAEGQSLRKAFLKAPLSFSRISSGFTMRRFHPITKTWKSHPAIDYAARPGTPIKTVGDGIIIKKGYTRGNGNYVKIRHNSSYETLYLHMKGFARGIAQGKRVSQGQTIGYVGSTGLATGPHLCFRMYKNGAPVNPHRVKAPSAKPVSAENLADFKLKAAGLSASLADQQPVKKAQRHSA